MASAMQERAIRYIDKVAKNTDVVLAVAVMGILVIMLVPIPTFLLDILLTLSISISIVILLVSIYAEKPLDFSSFPFVLLVTTLFRLALNVSTTRTILLNGGDGADAAGAVIQAFGQFVVGGNYIVGVIVFLILVLINFMVITKGSGRVAEVAARFTLDAMPGKQMAIDADLNAGIINESEAKNRRETIRREADFYGSMDGASKFVRGDAVAGLVITAINIIGGFMIGVLQDGMTMSDAASVFTILTIGDGLVSQIPALIISTAAGIVVTRAGNDSGSLAKQLTKQLFPQAKILFILSGILLFFAVIPGMPKISFIFLAAVSFGMGYLMRRKFKDGIVTDDEAPEEEQKPPAEDDQVKELLDMETLELEVGSDLIALVDVDKGGTLLAHIKAIRKQIATQMGFIVPPIRIRDNLQLDSMDYSVILRGVKVAKGTVLPDRFMALNPAGSLEDVDGVDAREPAFGLPAKWVDAMEKEKAILSGYTVVDPATVISTHLGDLVKKYSHDLVGRGEVQDLLDRLKEKHPKIVEDLIPSILDLSSLTLVLQNLLKENVSIRNLQIILETLATYAPKSKDIEYLTEKVRFALRKQICEGLLATDGKLYIFTLPSTVEQLMMKSIHATEDGREVVLDPQISRRIFDACNVKVRSIDAKGLPSILYVTQAIRYAVKRYFEGYVRNLNVIGSNEVADNIMIDSLGSVEFKDDATTSKAAAAKADAQKADEDNAPSEPEPPTTSEK